MHNTKQQTKKKQQQRTKSDFDWQWAAEVVAEDAHENHFSTHWGWERFDEGFLYFNNHPNQSRDELLASIRAWLKEQPELAEEAFAGHGDEEEEMDPADPYYDLFFHGDSYTVAMIISGPAKAEEKFEAAMERLHREWLTRLLLHDRGESEPQPLAQVIDINGWRSRREA